MYSVRYGLNDVGAARPRIVSIFRLPALRAHCLPKPSSRVRREDLERSSSQPEALIQGDGALELQAKLDATFGPTLTSITTLSPPGVTGGTTTNEPTNDGQYNFRLFANPTSKPLANESEVIKVLQPAPRIDIHTPTPEPENLGFVIPFRPRSFYIREDISAETRRQYEIAAVSGEVVQKWSRLPCVRTHRRTVLVPGHRTDRQ